MSQVILDQITQLAGQLSPEERTVLIERLIHMSPPAKRRITLEAVKVEHQRRLAAGAFDHVESLRNKYASPDFDLSEEELDAIIHEAANQWEEDLDDLFGED